MIMKKEYKIIFIKSIYFYVTTAIFIGQLYISYAIFMSPNTRWWYLPFFLLVTGTLQTFFYYYVAKLCVIIDDENIFIKTPDKITRINLIEIYKIERVLGWGSIQFYIFYRENGRKRTAGFPDQVQDYREILSYLEQKTGLKVKWGL